MDTRKTLLIKNIDGFPEAIELSDIPEEVRTFIEDYVSISKNEWRGSRSL